MGNINKGWSLAFLTCILWGLYTIFLKISASHLEYTNGLVIILQATIAASFLLLIFAGYGRLSIETLKNGKSWTFGTLQLLNNLFIFAALTYSITATSLTLLARFSIILSIIVAILFEKKKTKVSVLGFLMVSLGLVVVSLSLEIEYRGIILFWVFLMCLTKVHRSRVIVHHPANNKATGDFKAELRVTGYILAITSCFYAFILFAAMLLDFNQYAQYIVPTKNEFFALKPLLLAMGVGSILMAGMRYSEIVSTKHIGATNFLTIMAFTPVFTYFTQLFLAYIGKITYPNTNIYELSGGLCIVLGAILLTRKATKKDKIIKLLPVNNHILVLKDSITATLVNYKDDLVKSAKSLDITVEQLNNIMLDKLIPTSEDVKRIINNYSINISGLDYLTGDLNKKAFENKLNELRFLKKSSVLKVTIESEDDLIKHYGLDIYELILIEASTRISKIIKIPDIVAKTSNNEFKIIMYCSNKLCRYLTIRAINKQLNKSFVIDGFEHSLYINYSCKF